MATATRRESYCIGDLPRKIDGKSYKLGKFSSKMCVILVESHTLEFAL